MVALGLGSSPAFAGTIEVTTADDYKKIESAKAGDEVLIYPGTYRFRVHLTAKGTATNPIVIRAKDAANPPVWDLSSGNVEDAPGSYTAGDRSRGCWQFSGATNVYVSDLVITGCHNASHNSAGIRYYNSAMGIRLEHVYFHDNDNGLTGGTQNSDIVVEFCEFAQNGNAQASAPTHNIYIYGGTFVMRYSYLHDPIQAQNFHVRAKSAVLEYNWFARAKSYAGDLMTDDDNDGSLASTQNMLLRGNVIVQGDTQSNNSQMVAVYNDTGVADLTLQVRLLSNTFVGDGARAALVHLSNADGTVMSAELSNNIVYGTSRPTLVEDAAHATVTGFNNWLVTGADATGLSGSVFGTDPSFKNAAQNDFTLASGSSAIGAALTSVTGQPAAEYYRDEMLTCSYRMRATTKDIGAFESTTVGAAIGPHGNAGQAGAAGSGAGGNTRTSAGAANAGSFATGGALMANSGGNANRGGATSRGGSTSRGGTAAANGGANSSSAGNPSLSGTTGTTISTSEGGSTSRAGATSTSGGQRPSSTALVAGFANANTTDTLGGSVARSTSIAVGGSAGLTASTESLGNGSSSNDSSGCGCSVPGTRNAPGAFIIAGLWALCRRYARRGRPRR